MYTYILISPPLCLVIQSEVSQKEKNKYCYANTYMESKKRKKWF